MDKNNLLTPALRDVLIRTLKPYVHRGEFTLSSGIKSDYYIDCRPALLNSWSMEAIADCLVGYIGRKLDKNQVICGIPTSGLVMASAFLVRMASWMELRSCYVRAKGHGLKRKVEGDLREGDKIIIMDDVATTGHAIIDVAATLVKEGYKIGGAVVLVDRSGGLVAENMSTLNISYSYLIDSKELL